MILSRLMCADSKWKLQKHYLKAFDLSFLTQMPKREEDEATYNRCKTNLVCRINSIGRMQQKLPIVNTFVCTHIYFEIGYHQVRITSEMNG